MSSNEVAMSKAGKKKKTPELTFQQHIADYLVREYKYGVLEQLL